MQNQSLQLGAAAPTVRLFFYTTATGEPATVAFNAAGLALTYRRDNGARVALTLVTATLGTWVSGGFIVDALGIHDLYLPTAANASGAKSLLISATGLPTGISMIPCIVPLFADDISAAGASPASISTEIMTDLADASGTAARAAIAEQAALTIVGAADLRFDDTTGANLAIVRKSTSATVANVALRRGTRAQPIIGNG